MLHVLAGKLGADPEVKTIDTTNGKKNVCNMTVYVWTGERSKNNIPVQVTAWADLADELGKYKKGDSIQFVGEAKDVAYKPTGLDKELTVMGYDIKKIDHNKTILKDLNDILRNYIKPDKENEKSVQKEPEIAEKAAAKEM